MNTNAYGNGVFGEPYSHSAEYRSEDSCLDVAL